MEFKGVLFDLDGTLVNSLPAVERQWCLLAQRRGWSVAEVLDFIHGKQAITSLRHFLQGESEAVIQQEFARLEQAETEDLLGVYALPGVLELLRTLTRLGVPWGIVTSGSLPVAHARYSVVGEPHPSVFITAEEVARGKPEPDAYLLGAKRLGFLPEECVVLEDARAGIQAGLAAGCPVIAVNEVMDPWAQEAGAECIQSMQQIQVTQTATGFRITLSR